ncbi:MAG: hypothetical protein SZ59_C0006G0013 [candidate division TM6 bacterium GW2011_GWF2_28_16]|nr:MAG: hypothetical protein SZ59_C0006G0013 [candidate division TM6 bacterium GW2011_GWF2_28_16]
MNFFQAFYKRILFLINLIFILLINLNLYSVPMYNQYDPFVMHTIRGIDRFKHKMDDKFNVSLNLTPFYQHAAYSRGPNGANDADGSKTPTGDIFGRWNIFGLFYGVEDNQIKAAPTNKTFVLEPAAVATTYIPNAATRSSYPKISDAWRVLDNLAENNPVVNPTTYDYEGLDYSFTDITQYDQATFNKYFAKTYTDYEKYGLRLDLNFVFKKGIGVNVKSGLVDYKQTPNFVNDTSFQPTWPNEAIPVTTPDYIYKYMRQQDIMQDIYDEVGLDTYAHQETTLEDTFIQLFLRPSFDLMDNEDELQVSLVPYLAVGAWLPTGKEQNPDSAFSLPTGNNGFWGLTVDGAINFDLPGTIQFGFGGGIAYFFDRNLDGQRIANHELQQGVFPWKANIKKEPGLLWHFDASMYAPEFIDHFSAYLDFVYLRHNRDKITMQEHDSERNAYFVPSVNEENSKWWATILQGGVEYSFTPGLQIGLGFQTHLSGRRVYRDTTVLGTMTFVF